MIDRLPGIKKPNNRKLPYGELNWIFTAITDSIAWNVLPRHVRNKYHVFRFIGHSVCVTLL